MDRGCWLRRSGPTSGLESQSKTEIQKKNRYDNFIAPAEEGFNAKYGHGPEVYDAVISDSPYRL